MIDKRYVIAEHPDRKAYGRKLKFIRDAADGELDKGKWKILGKQPSRSKSTTGMVDQYLIRFEKESEHSFQESLILSHCFQYTKVVLDAYLSLFAGVKKTITFKNTSAEQQAAYEQNFDGEGTGVQDWLSDWFAEALICARTPVIVSSPEDAEYPYASLIPRENMRNWHNENGEFAFLTYDAHHVEVNGIKIESADSIWALTPEHIGEYEAKGNKAWVDAENPLGVVPVVDAWFFGGKSLLAPIASLDLNLMNLDREKRKVIRNQAGMNFFVTDEGVDLSKLSERTWIKNPRGADVTKPYWANYAAGSLGDAFQYGDRLIKAIYEISRLRRQKDDMAESGIAKTIDFTNTKAVLNHVSNVMENAFPRIISLCGEFDSNNMTAELKIDRSFDTTAVDAAIDTLIKELSSNFGPTADAFHKKQYLDTYSKMPDDIRKKAYAEIDNQESQRQKGMLADLDELTHTHEEETKTGASNNGD